LLDCMVPNTANIRRRRQSTIVSVFKVNNKMLAKFMFKYDTIIANISKYIYSTDIIGKKYSSKNIDKILRKMIIHHYFNKKSRYLIKYSYIIYDIITCIALKLTL